MIITNAKEMRNFLADEMSKLSAGESTPATINAMANLAGKMLQSIKLEIDYNHALGTFPSIDFFENINK